MKIALPSDDGRSICHHFGRTLGFLIYEIVGSTITSQVYVANTITGHVQGHHHDHAQSADHQHRSHGGILEALGEVQVVIAGGMGRRLYDDLAGAGKQVFVTSLTDAHAAVEAFIAGKLDSNPGGCCHHQH